MLIIQYKRIGGHSRQFFIELIFGSLKMTWHPNTCSFSPIRRSCHTPIAFHPNARRTQLWLRFNYRLLHNNWLLDDNWLLHHWLLHHNGSLFTNNRLRRDEWHGDANHTVAPNASTNAKSGSIGTEVKPPTPRWRLPMMVMIHRRRWRWRRWSRTMHRTRSSLN